MLILRIALFLTAGGYLTWLSGIGDTLTKVMGIRKLKCDECQAVTAHETDAEGNKHCLRCEKKHDAETKSAAQAGSPGDDGAAKGDSVHKAP